MTKREERDEKLQTEHGLLCKERVRIFEKISISGTFYIKNNNEKNDGLNSRTLLNCC